MAEEKGTAYHAPPMLQYESVKHYKPEMHGSLPWARQVADAVNQVAVARIRVQARARSAGRQPGYLGSSLRGVLGHALRAKLCLPFHRSPCADPNCVYTELFEPRGAPETGLRSWSDVPRPFVIEAPVEDISNVQPDQRLGFDILLFGTARGRREEVTEAMGQGLAEGLGQDRVSFDVEEMLSIDEAVDVGGHRDGQDVRVVFPLPTRIQADGKLQTQMSCGLVVRALLERLSALLCVYHGGMPELDFKEIVKEANCVPLVASTLKLQRLARHSNRQGKLIPLDGMVGDLVLGGGAVLDAVWPLLRAGQVVHVGKGSVYGLGRIVATDTVAQEQEQER